MKDLGVASVILNIKLLKDDNIWWDYMASIPLCGKDIESFGV
jgi:hypothetical protein